jgi:hypothetical protein
MTVVSEGSLMGDSALVWGDAGVDGGGGLVEAGREPAAAMVAAISSISATQRQPFSIADRAAAWGRAVRAGWDCCHSATRVCSTPSARARARIARINAAVPLVQAA